MIILYYKVFYNNKRLLKGTYFIPNLNFTFQGERLGTVFDRFAAEIEEDPALMVFSLDGVALTRTDRLQNTNFDLTKIIVAEKNYSKAVKTIQVRSLC